MKEQMKSKKPNYIFGNVLGNAMARVDMRTQLEASLMSLSFILVGMVLTTFYLGFYYHPPLWYKIVLIINLLAAMVFMSSFLITTFQQYRSYLDAMEFQKEMKDEEKDVSNVSNSNSNSNLKGGLQNAKKDTERTASEAGTETKRATGV